MGPFGMTKGMKVAVSIPDDVFEEAERLTEEQGGSRSALYAKALKEYIDRHAPDRITEQINAVIDEIGNEVDPFVTAAASRILRDTEW